MQRTVKLGWSLGLLGAALSAPVAVPIVGAEAQDAPAPAIAWRTDLAAARAEARDAGKPLFLVFRCET